MATRGFEFAFMLDGSDGVPVQMDLPRSIFCCVHRTLLSLSRNADLILRDHRSSAFRFAPAPWRRSRAPDRRGFR